ncbi:MAG: ROK family transcriptional regulator [Anaerolineae bacterium]|nr:ROK family transcriptional regulator [Anaerolineae bacterium]
MNLSHQSATTLQQATRSGHITQILQQLRTEAPLSRADLSRKTGLAKSSISAIVDEMLTLGLLCESDPAVNGVGKPSIGLTLNPAGGAAIGVEVNPGYVAVMLTNFVADILWEEVQPVDPGSPRESYFSPAETFIQQAIRVARNQQLPVLGIGVGLPGSVDLQTGTVVSSTSLNWYDVPVQVPWEERFNVPVMVDTEANMGAMGEHLYGCARDIDTFLYINQSFGFRRNIGLAMMLDGELWRGVGGFAGRVGHMVIDPSGPLCDCGQRGCWRVMTSDEMEISRVKEALAGGRSSLLRQYEADDYAALNSDLIHQAAICGDSVAREVMERNFLYSEQAITNLANIFDPGTVIISFSFTDVDKPEVQEIIESLTAVFSEFEQSKPLQARVERRLSHLGAQSAQLGAASMVLTRFIQNPKSARSHSLPMKVGRNGFSN